MTEKDDTDEWVPTPAKLGKPMPWGDYRVPKVLRDELNILQLRWSSVANANPEDQSAQDISDVLRCCMGPDELSQLAKEARRLMAKNGYVSPNNVERRKQLARLLVNVCSSTDAWPKVARDFVYWGSKSAELRKLTTMLCSSSFEADPAAVEAVERVFLKASEAYDKARKDPENLAIKALVALDVDQKQAEALIKLAYSTTPTR